VDPPPAPSSLSEKVAESGVTIDWVPPLAAVEGPAFAYNVYAGEGTGALNPAPIAGTTFEHGGVEFGVERCYRVRTVVTVVGVSIEGASSAPHCVTPRDTFPPAAPRELRAVAGDGVMNLGWDANTERDLAGYLVLRGEAPGATLQALTPAPIRETTYKDTTVKPGVRYTYAVVAVDTAMPPNTSAQARTDETAR
jgi:hypothetical protein